MLAPAAVLLLAVVLTASTAHIEKRDASGCIEDNAGYDGSPLTSVKNVGSAEDCQGICYANAACVAFAYVTSESNHFTKNSCWLYPEGKHTPTTERRAGVQRGPRMCPDTYEDMQCWKNKVSQKLTRLEGTDDRLTPRNYKLRVDPIAKCFAVAAEGKFEYFAIGNKGQCWAGKGDDYKFYGEGRSCPSNGLGYYGVVHVYGINRATAPTTTTTTPTTTTEATHDCEGARCKTASQYCGGTWPSPKSCKPLRENGDWCTGSRQCLSGNCSWAKCK